MAEVIIRNLDSDVRNKFKAVCARKGSTMQADLTKFIKHVVQVEEQRRDGGRGDE